MLPWLDAREGSRVVGAEGGRTDGSKGCRVDEDERDGRREEVVATVGTTRGVD